jgi:hypothetical protein
MQHQCAYAVSRWLGGFSRSDWQGRIAIESLIFVLSCLRSLFIYLFVLFVLFVLGLVCDWLLVSWIAFSLFPNPDNR